MIILSLTQMIKVLIWNQCRLLPFSISLS